MLSGGNEHTVLRVPVLTHGCERWCEKELSPGKLFLAGGPSLCVLSHFFSSDENKGMKRARTQDQQGRTIAAEKLAGREQLLLTSPELQTRLGRKFVDETELLPLLAHGLIRRVRTILIEVRPLGGDSLTVTLDASKPTVGEAKVEIARTQGTAAGCQALYRVAERADGLAVREDDAEPELLDDESSVLEDGDVVAMAVEVSWYDSAAIIDMQYG
jgi:hypothetical protein